MEVIQFAQHIYTSSKTLGEHGTYQYSKTLSKEAVEKLEKIGNYVAPQNLPSNPVSAGGIHKYPIAFIHALMDDKHVFSRVNYLGRDRHSRTGRMGNFFAHNLVQSSGDAFPMWSLFLHGAWQTAITDEEKGRLHPVQELKFQHQASHLLGCLTEVSSFLNESDRKQKAYQLIDAILNQKRVLIIDTPDALTNWGKVLTVAFPDHLMRQVTFSTYQCYPLRCDYQVVGITPENQFSEKDLSDDGFLILGGGGQPLHSYTLKIIDILTQTEPNNSKYESFLAYFAGIGVISEQLNLQADKYIIISKYQKTEQFSIEDFKKDFNNASDNPELQNELEGIYVISDPQGFFGWAEKQLQQKQGAIVDFEKYLNLLVGQNNKTAFFKQFLINYKTQQENGIFYQLLRTYEKIIDTEDIKEILNNVIVAYYKPSNWVTQAILDDANALNPALFTAIVERQPQYCCEQELLAAIKQLKKFELTPLKVCIQKYTTELENQVYQILKKVLEQEEGVKSYTLLIEDWLKPIPTNKEKISKQAEIIKYLFGIENIKNKIPTLKLLNAIVTIKETRSFSTFSESEKEQLRHFFGDDAEFIDLYLTNEFDYKLGNKDDDYKAAQRCLKLFPKFKLQIIEFYINRTYNYPYHNFRYLQLLKKYNFKEQDIDKKKIEFYLTETSRHLEESKINGNIDYVDDVKKTIKLFCVDFKLPVEQYITIDQHEKDLTMFNSEDFNKNFTNAKNLYQINRYSYSAFLGILYEGNFFKKYWTYERWKIFIKELELDIKTGQKNFETHIISTIDFLITKRETALGTDAKNQLARLLVEFVLALLVSFREKNALTALYKTLTLNKKEFKKIFDSECLAHVKYICDNNPDFRDFQEKLLSF